MASLWGMILELFNINERRRQLDLKILWPECCKQAPDIDHAKAAFAAHAFDDSAWLSLGKEEITRIINHLEPVNDRHAQPRRN